MWCVVFLFSLGFVAVVSGTGQVSDGAVCVCNKLSTLTCTLSTQSDFVNGSYCGERINAVELHLLRNLYVSSSMIPDIPIFRLRITGDHLNKLPEDTFKGHEDSLQFVEIMHGAFSYIPSEALQRLHYLESLSMAGNSIYSIDCSFKDAPLKNLMLHDNEISLVYPCSFPQKLRTLSLKNNKIENLNGSLKHHNDLMWLFIERNKITSLEGELEGLNNLFILHASWNKITTIGFERVNVLKLHTLDLSHNRLSEFGDSLNGFPNLYSLDLSHNDIEILRAGMFDSLQDLKILSLSANNIRSLDDGVFRRISSLSQLTISNNVISNLDGKLDTLRSLKKLDASFNNIRIIGNAFANLKALEELDLQYNHIFELGNALSTASRLKSLDLTFNSLKELNEGELNGMKNLEKLNLSYNSMRALNGTVFASLTELATLDLSDNLVQNLKALVVPGFMNITLSTTEDTTKESNNCKRPKSLILTNNLVCSRDSEETQLLAILHKNGIDVVGC